MSGSGPGAFSCSGGSDALCGSGSRTWVGLGPGRCNCFDVTVVISPTSPHTNTVLERHWPPPPARQPGMAPWAITEARCGSVGHPEVIEKLQDSQFASAAPVICPEDSEHSSRETRTAGVRRAGPGNSIWGDSGRWSIQAEDRFRRQNSTTRPENDQTRSNTAGT